MTFGSDMKKFSEGTKRKLDLVHRKVGYDVSYKVILRSPVQDGFLRGAWQASIGAAIESDTGDISDKSGSATVNSMRVMIDQAAAIDTFFLSNNKPYAYGIEHGDSVQRPEGMVAVTVAEFKGIVDQAVRTIK